MDLRTEIIGENNLLSQFDKIQENLQKKVQGILADGAQPTLQAMISKAPKSEHGSTGNKLASRNHAPGTLKRSIGIVRSKGIGAFPTIWVKPIKTWGKDPDGWYAHFVEFGPPGYPGYEAHPFVRPAVDSTIGQVESSIIRLITEEVVNNWGR
jgi:HK97 gp10 family phage protein